LKTFGQPLLLRASCLTAWSPLPASGGSARRTDPCVSRAEWPRGGRNPLPARRAAFRDRRSGQAMELRRRRRSLPPRCRGAPHPPGAPLRSSARGLTYSSVCFRPSCITWSPRESRSEPGRGLDNAPPRRMGSPPPQGPSLGSGLCSPGPSSLNRPHPPHSRAHRDFTASRLIRHAFAVRERLCDPRVVPGFRCPFFPGMPPSMTPGSSASA
jgi:hypothetical protein